MAAATDALVRMLYGCLTRRRPVVLGLMGPRFCGKSTFVAQASETLQRAAIPCASADVQARDPVDVTARDPAWTEDLLDHLVADFSAAPSDYGRVRFPRYLLARSILVQPMASRAPADVRARVAELLRDTTLADDLAAVAGDLAGAVAAVHGMPEQSVRDLGRRLTAAVFRTGPGGAMFQRAGAAWFTGNALLDGVDGADAGLARLWEWRHAAKRPLRLRAERVLVAAWLADLRESAASGSWDGTYALLLDNADHNDAGVRLVRYLARGLGDDDRITVAATHRGGLLAALTTAAGDDPAVEPAGVPVADPEKPLPAGGPWHPLRLPELTEGETRDLVRDLTSWDEQAVYDVAAAVHGLTRGHPGVTEWVCRAARDGHDPAAGPLDLRSALDADRLIARLTGGMGNQTMADLVTCAAVRDRDHVSALIDGPVDAASLGALLRDELWVPGRAGRLVLLPVLRRLLLDRLARRAADEPNAWDVAFECLAEHARDAGDEESRLYYRLALGDVEAVTRRLAERLAEDDPAWFGVHRRVTFAPNRALGADEDVLAKHNAWARAEDQSLLLLANLVVRRWLAADPLRPPPVRSTIKNEYTLLAELFPAASARLLAEAAWWDD